MIRQSALLSVVFGLALHASVSGEIINVPGDQPTIQAAIDAAADGDEIVVAPGTYFENINLLGKAVTLRSSAGAEVTAIDANGNGTVVKCINGEGPDTVIDGFTITGGNATDDSPDNRGGGMRNEESSPTVIDCTFIGNTAEKGGGMSNSFDSNPTVTNCTFSGNEGENSGGGILNSGSSPTVTNCTFSANSAVAFGGGMINTTNSNPTVTNCTFSGNSAYSGGGMQDAWHSNSTVTNCTFSGNSANFGGGMYNIYGSSPAVTNCTFSGNSATDHGGGVGNRTSSTPTVTNCTFSGNSATNGGGMSNDDVSSPTVTNCTFSGNSATDHGGGIFSNSGNPTVVNCTFSGNDADNGGGMWMITHRGNNPTVTDCIVWNNIPDEIAGPGTPTVTYSDVQGGWPGVGNIDADPMFVDPDGPDDIPGTQDDNLRLSPGSPVIDAADNTGVPADTQDLDGDGDTDEPVPVDLEGNPRFVDDPLAPDTGNPDGIHPIVDMGAYEFGPPDPCVDEDGDGRVTICHIPPGNPDNAHTITISVNALPAHLAHGDHCGACEEDDGLLMGGSSDVNPEPCPTDLDDSGDIGAEDLAQLLGSWGACAGCPADLNGDGVVGAPDLAVLLGAWGLCSE